MPNDYSVAAEDKYGQALVDVRPALDRAHAKIASFYAPPDADSRPNVFVC